jgi:predicted ATPase
VLLSDVTRELMQDDVPHDATFTDLGLHRLKDLAQPEHVWQVSITGLSGEFAPLKSLNALPNNLPIQVTSFYGREQDLEELKAHLADHRLVTLFGAGGVGKTRLAAQVGAELLEEFPDGVWIADLAPIMEQESVASVIAQALGVSQAQGRLVDAWMSRFLKGKQLLLILDNCEHVLETVARISDEIHRNCPNVRILATSRQALDVSGEKVLRLASLAIADKTAHLTAAEALQFGSIALFVDRASLVNRSFRLTDENAPIVAEICRRLDGIPLAIELAAARVKALSVSSLAQHLDNRFKLLTGASRSALPRQKTLAALIDWSYDLLTPQERVVFNRVAIFAGDFTLEAAAAVCSGRDIEQGDVFDLVISLADKSLVVADISGNQGTYGVLESTRQYALNKLTESGEREQFARRHAEYFLEIAQAAANSFGSMPLSGWLEGLGREMENFRAALEWTLSRGHAPTLGGEIASALTMFWWHGGVEAEGVRWIEAALLKNDESEHPDVVAQLRRARALLMSRVLYS